MEPTNESTEHEEIIVYKRFSDAIEANIAKSKLDAHDIPCFLTGEHMASLYPGQRLIPFDVRLHIFKKDRDRVARILMAAERGGD